VPRIDNWRRRKKSTRKSDGYRAAGSCVRSSTNAEASGGKNESSGIAVGAWVHVARDGNHGADDRRCPGSQPMPRLYKALRYETCPVQAGKHGYMALQLQTLHLPTALQGALQVAPIVSRFWRASLRGSDPGCFTGTSVLCHEASLRSLHVQANRVPRRNPLANRGKAVLGFLATAHKVFRAAGSDCSQRAPQWHTLKLCPCQESTLCAARDREKACDACGGKPNSRVARGHLGSSNALSFYVR